MKLLPELLVLVVLFYDASGADLRFVTTPNNTCVPRGQQAEFPCRAEAGNFAAGQKWMVTTTGGGSTSLGPANPGEFPQLPVPYEWIVDSSGNVAAGLRVVTADNEFNSATFQCIASFQGDSTSAPAAMLEVSDPFSTFSCQNVACPQAPFVPETNDKCTVHWARPQTVSCGSIIGYNVTIAMASTSVSAADFMYETAALEPYTSYTATVTAINDVNMTSCSLDFTTSEQAPVNFTLLLNSLIPLLTATFSLTPTVARPPRVVNYSITITDVTGQQVGAVHTFLGSSSSLSLDISSLPQCMSYTVSVTASNTGGSATTNTTLSLDPLTSLEVSCVAGEDGCYLEASCVPSQPGLVSGCRLDYTSGAGAASRNVTQLNTNSRIASVSCDYQTISYTGRAYDSILRPLGCPRSGATECPLMNDCPAVSVINGTVQYSTEPSASGNFTGGTVTTYSCADGYELVREENRTCLVDGTWTGAEPQCRYARQDSVSHVWFPISITLLIYSVVSTAAIVALTLFSCRIIKGGHRAAVPSHSTKEEVALKENLCYGPVTPPPPPPPAATQTVSEYEEIGASSPKYL